MIDEMKTEKALKEAERVLVWKMGVPPGRIFPEAELAADLGLDAVDLADFAAYMAESLGADPAELAKAIDGRTTAREAALAAGRLAR